MTPEDPEEKAKMTEAPQARRTPGTPCWVSLMVRGLPATEDFYAALFGWEFEPGPEQLSPYLSALLGGKEVAGIGRMPSSRNLSVDWTTYLATDNADETADTIRDCGGTVAVGPLEVGDSGRLAIVSDPAGAVFGIWEGRRHSGAPVTGRHGTPVWNELVTKETVAVGKFYSAIFGYEAEEDPSGGADYLTLRLDGRPVAALHGVGKVLPLGRGPYWMTYFEVEDTDAAAQRAVQLGGRVLEPPRDGATGRLATIADPEGAVFTIGRTDR
jgi:predicted enzyme related to lactoylglutathione lyase